MIRGTLLVAVLVLAGCSSSGGGGSSDDPADLLASSDGSSDVTTYRATLDAWADSCTQDRVRSAGIVDATYNDEQSNNGPDSSRLEVMQNLIGSVPASMPTPTDCTSIAAAYLVLVER
jgi:hypothetical protein